MASSQARLIRLARNVNWYESPEVVVANPGQLLVETMARGSADDILEAQALFSEEQFQEAYRNARPGLFDRRNWAYWGLKLLGSSEALPFPELNPDAGWEWPESFQDNTQPGAVNADDINELGC